VNNNEIIDKALAQARQMQRTMNEAMTRAGEQMTPLLEESLKNARELQNTLQAHAAETSAVAQQQAHTAIDHLQRFLKVGTEVVKQSADQARAQTETLLQHQRNAIDSAMAALGKKPEDAQPK